MRSPHLVPAAALLLCGCAGAQRPAPASVAAAPTPAAAEPAALARVELANPSTFARPDTLAIFSLAELGVTAGPLQVWAGGSARPTQLLDDDGDGRPDRLAFLADLGAAAVHDYVVDRRVTAATGAALAPRAHAEVSVKQGGEWQGKKYVGGSFQGVDHITSPPQNSDHSEFIRYEGPGLESDLVAYRFYLDWRNGFDIFGKKSSAIVLPGVGLDGYDSYHAMSDWGADILKVGQSLGMGGYGRWDGTKVVLVSEVAERSTTIRADGPIYAALDLGYRGWQSGAATVDLTATLSMRAGSPFVDVALATSAPLDNLAIGLVKHPKTELLSGDLDVTGEAWSYFATFGPQSLFDDGLGMVLLFHRQDLIERAEDEQSHVLVMRPRGRQLAYAFGALWAGRPGGIQNRAELEAYLAAEVERRTLPPRVRLRNQASAHLGALAPLELAKRLAVSEIARRGDSLAYGGWDAVSERPSAWNYTTGLLAQAMDELGAASGDARFTDYARRTIESYVTADGAIRTYDPTEYNIDQINSGKMLLRLHARDPQPRYRAAIDALASQLEKHPRTAEGAFWHKQRYPDQLWLDGVYMGMPFLAGVGRLDGDERKIEEAVREVSIARSHLRDPATGLYFHAWDEARRQAWADPRSGRSRQFWGRGLGWYAMALVDLLDLVPREKSALRAPLLEIVPELAASLVKVQDEGGVWYQILDRPGEPGNYREASASAMFTYFLAKGVRAGYLPATYEPAARKAWAGLVREFVAERADGALDLRNVCAVGGLGYGRDGSYRYYMSEPVIANDPKGLGPAILAGIEISKLPRAARP